MPTVPFQPLNITGPDALTFLQGQLTCDMNTITNTPGYGAYCDIRGRVVANFLIEAVDGGFRLWLPNGLRDTFIEIIQKYATFSKVELHAINNITPTFDTDRLSNIQAGIAWLTPKTSAKFTPQMINWEKLDGVSFTKGCFLGQEVVARTQHLGKLKRHLYCFTATGDVAPNAGDSIMLNNKPAGTVCDAVLHHDNVIGLAVIEDRAQQAPLHLPSLNQLTVQPV